MAAIGAASEAAPLTAAAIKARAFVAAEAGLADVDADADVSVSVLGQGADDDANEEAPPAKEPGPSPLERLPLLSREGQNETRPHNGTNHTNGSRPPPPPPVPPTNGTRPDKAPALSPERQDSSGMAGAPIRFVVTLTNPAKTPQNVTLLVKAPTGWDVRLNPEGALLGPDESLTIRGSVVTPRLVGTYGTIAITASGAGGDDVAYVDLCSAGELGNACDATHRRAPANETRPQPPSNQTPPQNETPPANDTPTTPAPTPEPTHEDPAPEETAPTPPPSTPSNSTGNSTSRGNSTAPSSGSSSGGSTWVEAWVTVEASASSSGGTDEGTAAAPEDDDQAEPAGDDDSHAPVQVDV